MLRKAEVKTENYALVQKAKHMEMDRGESKVHKHKQGPEIREAKLQ